MSDEEPPGRHYVLMTGGRKYAGREAVTDVLNFLRLLYGPRLRVMHGGADGLDSMVGEVCETLGIAVKGYPVRSWYKDGKLNKAAGFERNSAMVDLVHRWTVLGEHTGQVIAWPGGNGTKDCARKAEEAGLMVDYIAPTPTEPGPAVT